MRRVVVLAPFSGRVLRLEDVPDPVFSDRLIGDGLAIDPMDGVGCSPLSGKLTTFHSAGHAFVVQASEGEVAVLVHVGLNTVHMRGQGFARLAKDNDQVTAGQVLVRFDLAAIAAAGYSAISPVVLPDLPSHFRVERTTAEDVRAAEDVLLTVEIPD
jgi:glucose-specific phosphotransferase system IIA component